MYRKKLVFFVNTDWFFSSHRLPIALEAIKLDYEVHLITNFTTEKDTLNRLGIITHHIELSRSSLNIFKELKSIYQLYKILKKISPDIVHFITNKCVLYGGIVTFGKREVVLIGAISGLGYTFTEKKLKTVLIKKIITIIYKIILNNMNFILIFQNSFDQSFFTSLKLISKDRTVLIKGSGVCLSEYKYSEEPAFPITISMISRLIKEKGIFDFLDASQKISSSHPEIVFQLVGDIDKGNPNSLNEEDLKMISTNSCIKYLGYRKDVKEIIKNSHIIVHPSYYGEGIPKILIEAAAIGRAIITTDNPGCLESVIKNKTALVVPKQNPEELAKAILELINNKDKRINFGKNGREFAENNFNINTIIKQHLNLYENKHE